MTPETRQTNHHGDDVAALIRLAGQRPAIAVERIERAREAAHATWQREIRRRSRRRYAQGAVALAAAASLVFVAVYLRLPGGAARWAGVGGSLQIQLLAGEAEILTSAGEELSAPRALAASESVPAGSVLTTSGARRAAVRLRSGHSLRLDLSTRVRLEDPRSLYLERGAVYLASDSEEGGSEPATVHTPLGAISEIGTQFEVRLAGEVLHVRVREGAILLHHGDEAQEVAIGTEFELNPDGSTSTREISTHGPEWEWVSAITPMIDLEGRTARMFLDWVARERGWRLAFADEAAARAAERIEVAGDLRGMTIEQALEAVLPSCRMTHRISEGTLLIEAIP